MEQPVQNIQQPQKKSIWPWVSLILLVLAIMVSFFPRSIAFGIIREMAPNFIVAILAIIFGIPAIITGIIMLIKRTERKGIAITNLILGIIFLVYRGAFLFSRAQ